LGWVLLGAAVVWLLASGAVDRTVTGRRQDMHAEAAIWLPQLMRGFAGPFPTPVVGTPTPTGPRPTTTTSATPTPDPASSRTATLTPPLATPSSTATGTGTPAAPGVPACARVTGDAGGFRFSLDDGVTLAPGARALDPLAYTWDVDVDPRDPNDILQLHQGKVYASGDAGCTWRLIDQPGGTWDSLARAPSDPDLLVLTSVFAHALRLSTDGGGTWREEELPDDVVHFAIDPTDAWHWMFAGREALFERAAAGAKWERVAPPRGRSEGEQITAAAQAPGRWGRWLVGLNFSGLFRSDDGGRSWAPAGGDMEGQVGDPPERVLSVVPAWVSFAPSDASTAFAVVNQVGRDASLRGIWRTGDGGEHWERRVADGDPVGGGAIGVQLTGGTRVFVSPHDPERVYFASSAAATGCGRSRRATSATSTR